MVTKYDDSALPVSAACSDPQLVDESPGFEEPSLGEREGEGPQRHGGQPDEEGRVQRALVLASYYIIIHILGQWLASTCLNFFLMLLFDTTMFSFFPHTFKRVYTDNSAVQPRLNAL